MMWKFVVNTAWMLLMIAISGLVYIRLAPHDPGALHVVPPTGAAPGVPVIKQGSALYVEIFNVPPKTVLENLNTIALAMPRSHILSGNAETGMITYVTRSLVFGFPDYTTVHATADGQGSRVTLYARLRFGRSDFGVNSARIRNWLQALKALDQPG